MFPHLSLSFLQSYEVDDIHPTLQKLCLEMWDNLPETTTTRSNQGDSNPSVSGYRAPLLSTNLPPPWLGHCSHSVLQRPQGQWGWEAETESTSWSRWLLMVHLPFQGSGWPWRCSWVTSFRSARTIRTWWTGPLWWPGSWASQRSSCQVWPSPGVGGGPACLNHFLSKEWVPSSSTAFFYFSRWQ